MSDSSALKRLRSATVRCRLVLEYRGVSARCNSAEVGEVDVGCNDGVEDVCAAGDQASRISISMQ